VSDTVTTDRHTLRRTAWWPAQIGFANGAIACDWLYAGSVRLTAPFFYESVFQLRETPFNRLFWRRTDARHVLAAAESVETLPWRGVVLHTSRCGSTLASQLLSLDPAHRVFSEPEMLPSLLRMKQFLPPQVSTWIQSELYPALLACLGSKRNDEEHSAFLKLDLSLVSNLDDLMQAIPLATPTLGLFRHPLETAVSQMVEPSATMNPGVPGIELPDVLPEETARMPYEDYLARRIAQSMQALLDLRQHRRVTLIDYVDVPTRMPELLQAWLRSPLNDDMKQRWSERSQRHSKYPRQAFQPDSARKQAEASPQLTLAIERFAMPTYRALRSVAS
jgi:hypothetical protein